ncbi:hypothetical protein LEL_07998 [Akanthomyces lecanii RCEF 1005]|uniref:Uncharacterized protein n=1 Tax=Akanthomyces lecanii RCEF 1005 TaxID=1081108 RepID=A0A168EYP3_CORDF|nr:hypothetical protein LEL_07998 [Akanthomyces lecanii RCEF 1005]
MVASDFLTATAREDKVLARYAANRLFVLTSNQPLTTWNPMTQAHVKAAKHLSQVLWWNDQDHERSLAISRTVAISLSRGDRECRTRALQIQKMVEDRSAAGNVANPTSYTDRGVTSATIAETIGDIPEESANWGRKRSRLRKVRLTKEQSEEMKEEAQRRNEEQGELFAAQVSMWRTEKKTKRAERVHRRQEKWAQTHKVALPEKRQEGWKEWIKWKTAKMQRREANRRRATDVSGQSAAGSMGST